MDETNILNIILCIICYDFALDRFLGYLNQNSSNQIIPDELSGIYDAQQYKNSQEYQVVTGKFGTISSTFSFLVTFAAIYFGWFGNLDLWIRNFAEMEIITSIWFFVFIFIISDLIGIPFSLYQNFVIEEKFGFNKMTIKTFILDKLKSYVLTIIIGGILLSALLALVAFMGSQFWIYFWAVVGIFILGANLFYTSLILPLFNKLKPLEEGDLKSSIEAFSQKVKFPLTNIFVMDGSKRSSKGNAFFSGFGNKKKVVLFDTLIENHTTDELTAVFAHEVGHYKRKHIYLGTVLSVLQVGFILYLLSLMIFNSDVSYAMGGNMTAIHLNILAFGILFSPLSRLLGIIMNIISRKNEFEADEYAVLNFKAGPLIDGLKKMSSDHLSNLTPHPAFVFVHYSHPPLLQRVQAMMKLDRGVKN